MIPRPLPFVLPKPKPKQPQRQRARNRMTILAGFSSTAGAILCADTQETVGYAKRNVNKIEVKQSGKTIGESKFRVAIAAGGTSYYADKLTQELFDTIRSFEEYEPKEIIEAIEAKLTEFYTKHLWPRANVQDAPQIELLILFQAIPDDPKIFVGYPLLLHVAETAVNIVQSYKTVGIGSWLADYILERLQPHGRSNKHCLVALGAYLMKEIRENVDGCGKDAEIMFFGRDGTWEDVSGGDVLQFLESHVGDINETFSEVLYRIGQIPIGYEHEGHSSIEAVIEDVERVRGEYAEAIRLEEKRREQQRREMEEYRRNHPRTGTEDIPF
jgi:hypothetical protein